MLLGRTTVANADAAQTANLETITAAALDLIRAARAWCKRVEDATAPRSGLLLSHAANNRAASAAASFLIGAVNDRFTSFCDRTLLGLRANSGSRA
jgi:hypothetical protein